MRTIAATIAVLFLVIASCGGPSYRQRIGKTNYQKILETSARRFCFESSHGIQVYRHNGSECPSALTFDREVAGFFKRTGFVDHALIGGKVTFTDREITCGPTRAVGCTASLKGIFGDSESIVLLRGNTSEWGDTLCHELLHQLLAQWFVFADGGHEAKLLWKAATYTWEKKRQMISARELDSEIQFIIERGWQDMLDGKPMLPVASPID